MDGEKLTEKYGRLMTKHWKAGNDKMAKYYHDKLHELYELAKNCPICFGEREFKIRIDDGYGGIEKEYKQPCLNCNK